MLWPHHALAVKEHAYSLPRRVAMQHFYYLATSNYLAQFTHWVKFGREGLQHSAEILHRVDCAPACYPDYCSESNSGLLPSMDPSARSLTLTISLLSLHLDRWLNSCYYKSTTISRHQSYLLACPCQPIFSPTSQCALKLVVLIMPLMNSLSSLTYKREPKVVVKQAFNEFTSLKKLL